MSYGGDSALDAFSDLEAGDAFAHCQHLAFLRDLTIQKVLSIQLKKIYSLIFTSPKDPSLSDSTSRYISYKNTFTRTFCSIILKPKKIVSYLNTLRVTFQCEVNLLFSSCILLAFSLCSPCFLLHYRPHFTAKSCKFCFHSELLTSNFSKELRKAPLSFADKSSM